MLGLTLITTALLPAVLFAAPTPVPLEVTSATSNTPATPAFDKRSEQDGALNKRGDYNAFPIFHPAPIVRPVYPVAPFVRPVVRPWYPPRPAYPTFGGYGGYGGFGGTVYKRSEETSAPAKESHSLKKRDGDDWYERGYGGYGAGFGNGFGNGYGAGFPAPVYRPLPVYRPAPFYGGYARPIFPRPAVYPPFGGYGTAYKKK